MYYYIKLVLQCCNFISANQTEFMITKRKQKHYSYYCTKIVKEHKKRKETILQMNRNKQQKRQKRTVN